MPIGDVADAEDEDPRLEPDGVVAALDRLCSAVSTRAGLVGATVTLMPGIGSHAVAAASSPEVRRLEEAQFALGEGPGRDAFRTRRVILVNLHDVGMLRWPGYAPLALDAGVGGIGAFPLRVGGAIFGVLTAYSLGVLDPDQSSTVLGFADVATDLIVDRSVRDGNGRLATDLDAALGATLDTHAHVYQAQGMVMADLRITLAEALSRMRAHAWANSQELTTLAAEIVAGRTRLPRDET